MFKNKLFNGPNNFIKLSKALYLERNICLNRLHCPNVETITTGKVSSVQKMYSTTSTLPTENAGLIQKVLKKVGFKLTAKSRLKSNGFILYETVADKINYLEFFKKFELPNTFNSWFIVTELHVWMLLVRSMAEGAETGEEGRELRNIIVEALWADVNARAKKLGGTNPSDVKNQISILSEQFQASLIAYDEAIMSDDKTLAAALWRRFFNKNCTKLALLEELVLYVRLQMHTIDSLSRDEFLKKPRIMWAPLEDVKI